ncbi:MAG: cyanophycin synthetase [Elusimicrobia bacterium]|nr:MAG: cyanophycin synthetase [Elusimicrobiota bacterium]
MEVSRLRALRGPNLWSRHTSLEAIVCCAEDERNIDRLPGFESRLRERFPELAMLHPLGNDDAVSMAQALEFAALGLQAQAGCPVTFSRTTQTIDIGTYQVVVEYSEEAVGRLAFQLAEALCQAAVDDAPFSLDDALRRLRELDEDVRLGPSTGAIVHAAVARNIPFRRLTEGSLVQFGWGSRQRRIQAAETDRTSAIAESIAQDKELSKLLLQAAGVPVPEGRPVLSAEDAWAAACEIGCPVVVKPQDGNQGRGVAVNLTTREEIEAAYAIAFSVSDEVLVERFLPGHDYRLLVVGNRLVAAARRDPPLVVGDGAQTIRQLVERVNLDPRRGEGHATSLTRIRLDDIALARLGAAGLTPESIPSKGRRVVLRNNANLSTGGTATDVTDDVHLDLAAQAVAAVQAVGLDIAGVDVVCDSVLHPLEAQAGGIVEVNAAPGLRMHLQPSYGKGRPVGEAIVANLFADGDDARIPVVAVAGTNGKTTTVRLIARLLGQQGLRVGMTTTDGLYVAGKRIDSGDCAGPKSARNLLLHPGVDAAVLETARGGVLREGLGFDRCDVAVVTNIGLGDHLGLSYISTVEDLSVVKRVIVQNVRPGCGVAVLNAADPMVARMADSCPGKVIFFACDRNHPVMATQRARRKRVVYRDGAAIVAAGEGTEQRLTLAEIPLTQEGRIGFQVENVMAAVAAAWALGVDWATIRAGLAGFVSDAQTAPGRFNVFQHQGATIVADYGHNPDAIQALVNAIDNLPCAADGRRTVVISGAGDRRDQDLRQQTEILGDAFDRVILYQDQCQRGRADGEVLALLREGLRTARRTSTIEEIRGEFLAIDAGLAGLGAGDLCLILVDQIEEALAYIARRLDQDGASPSSGVVE